MFDLLLTCLIAASEGDTPQPPQPPAPKEGPDRAALFTKADADSDGKLSLQEFLVGWKQNERQDGERKADEFFTKADADGNGQLSKEEFRKFHEMMRNGRPPGPPPGGPGERGPGDKSDRERGGERGERPEGDRQGPPPGGPQGGHPRRDPRELFLAIDQDGDGFVTKEEFTQFKPQRPPKPEGHDEGGKKPPAPPREPRE